jgi:hypothetical protein
MHFLRMNVQEVLQIGKERKLRTKEATKKIIENILILTELA